MTSSYEIEYPRKVIFGCGSIAKLANELPKHSRILLTTGDSAVKSGLRDKVLAILSPFKVSCISGIASEPPLEDVDRLVEAGREEKFTVVVAIGGGSVIDAAKAAAAIIPAGGHTSERKASRERACSSPLRQPRQAQGPKSRRIPSSPTPSRKSRSRFATPQ